MGSIEGRGRRLIALPAGVVRTIHTHPHPHIPTPAHATIDITCIGRSAMEAETFDLGGLNEQQVNAWMDS